MKNGKSLYLLMLNFPNLSFLFVCLLKFHKIMAVPLVTYDCENYWTLNRIDRRRIETDEMKYLKPLAGKSILDKKEKQEYRNNR